jgi:hypothetical protein
MPNVASESDRGNFCSATAMPYSAPARLLRTECAINGRSTAPQEATTRPRCDATTAAARLASANSRAAVSCVWSKPAARRSAYARMGCADCAALRP